MLRLGLLVDSIEFYAWEAAMLQRISDSGVAEIVLIVLSDPPKPRLSAALDPHPRHGDLLRAVTGALLLKIYRVLEAKITCEGDAFQFRETLILKDIRRISIPATVKPDNGRLANALGEIRELDLDVIVQLGAAELSTAISAAAKYGVWSLRHTHCASGDAMAAGFWPVYGRWPFIESRVEVVAASGESVTVAHSCTGANPYSVKLCRSALFWKTLSLIPRQLQALHGLPEQAPRSAAVESDVQWPARANRDLGAPGIAELGLHIARNVQRRARDWALRNFALEPWTLLFHLGDELCTSGGNFTAITSPKDRYWADPCVVRRNDDFYVFIEEYCYETKRGHISVLAIDRNGIYGQPVRVLEREYHLSYPCVFEDGNNLFMIPESSENRTIDLYRCLEFPAKWEFVKTLLDDISAVDTTVFHHQGKWWMFTDVVENTGASSCEELFLFHSDDLVDGAWTPHRNNPLVSDVRRARPAGRIFLHEGKLYRPAQDCSVRYGYAIVLHQITRLSEDHYEEIEVTTIKPTWDRTVVATHTLSYVPGLTVIDALQPRLRL